MTKSSRNVRHAVHLALAACAAGAAMPLAYAQTTSAATQTAPAAAASAPALEEVVVTGSRLLQSPNAVSISPITSVSATDIEQTGMTRTEDILNMLPQVSAEQSSGTSISASGIATVSLRALGSQRTLVLINGRRMQPGGAGGVVPASANSPDVNQIPPELIQRVDVLTGGASAVYGADAVAGVVNFILDTHFQGVKIDGEYSFNNHENNNELYKSYLTAFNQPLPPSTVNTGQTRNFSIVVGSDFADGKGNATAYTTYLHSNAAVGNQFDHAGCTLNGVGGTPTAPGSNVAKIACGGSSTSGHGAFEETGFVPSAGGGYATTLFKKTIDPTTGQMRPYVSSKDAYNYGALSYFQRPADKWTSGAFVHYDINEHAQIYTETMFSRNTSLAQYGPSGAFAYQKYVTDCSTNPLLSAPYSDPTVHAGLCDPANIASNQAFYNTSVNPGVPISGQQVYIALGRRNVEGGGRQDNYTSDAIRQVAGLKGGWGDVWTYDVYGTYGISDLSDHSNNYLGTNQVQNALMVVGNPSVGGVAGVPVGAPVCQAALNGTDPACVPWNVYSPTGVTPAQLAYLTVPAGYTQDSTEYIVDGSVTGELGKYGVKLPTANSGLSVNVGTEYRSENFNFNPDYIWSNGLQEGGAPSQAINGGFHVWEGFTEMRLPLLSDMTMAQDLSLEGGYRYSSYSLGFNTNTYKVGLEWTPIHDVRLRGSYNRAVRAPNLNELFTPATVGAGGNADPCWGQVDPATGLVASGYTPAECAKTGVSPQQYGHIQVNTATQTNTKVGGNPNLQPEKADTYTFGLVYQPTWLHNFVASVDYWNVTITNTIISLPSATIIDECARGGGSTCDLIHRGPTGSLWTETPQDYVSANYQNIGKLSTKGIDVLSSYHLDLPRGNKLSFDLNGTYTMSYLTQNITGGPMYDCVGFYGQICGAPLPAWRHVFNSTWLTPWAGLDLTFRWRFIGPSSVDGTSQNPQMAGPYYVGADHIPGYNYFDFSASMPIGSNVDVRVGVNNIADKNPPLVPSDSCITITCNDNTWVGTYDTLGRFIYGHITIKF